MFPELASPELLLRHCAALIKCAYKKKQKKKKEIPSAFLPDKRKMNTFLHRDEKFTAFTFTTSHLEGICTSPFFCDR